MKITDEQLLVVVSESQLIQLAERSLTKYVGGIYAVERNDDTWFMFSSVMYHQQIKCGALSKYQQLKRLRKLSPEYLVSYDNRSNLSFYIDNERMRAAYEAARQFWLGNGVPDHHSKAQPIDNLDTLINECKDMLLNRFGGTYCLNHKVAA